MSTKGKTHSELSDEELRLLSEAAWSTRDHAWILGNTRVGAAVITRNPASVR